MSMVGIVLSVSDNNGGCLSSPVCQVPGFVISMWCVTAHLFSPEPCVEGTHESPVLQVEKLSLQNI